MILFIFILWLLYAVMEGNREGFYWNMLFSSGGKPTVEHDIWTIQRAVVAIGFVLFSVSLSDSFTVLLILLVYPLVFPFFHDGVYYRTRNIVSKGEYYNLRFWDQSTTSTAFSTRFCTPFLRTLYFTIGVGLLIFIML